MGVLGDRGLRGNRRTLSSPGCFAGIIRQHLAVFLAHGDEELINGHGRVNCDFAAEEVLDVVLLCIRYRVSEVEKRYRKLRWVNTHEWPSEHVRRLGL